MDEASTSLLSRFGSSCIQHKDFLVVLGGIGRDGVIPRNHEVLLCSVMGSKIRVVGAGPVPEGEQGREVPRPLLVGSSIVSPQDGEIVIMSGGATCFSMGSFCTCALTLASLATSCSKKGLWSGVPMGCCRE